MSAQAIQMNSAFEVNSSNKVHWPVLSDGQVIPHSFQVNQQAISELKVLLDRCSPVDGNFTVVVYLNMPLERIESPPDNSGEVTW